MVWLWWVSWFQAHHVQSKAAKRHTYIRFSAAKWTSCKKVLIDDVREHNTIASIVQRCRLQRSSNCRSFRKEYELWICLLFKSKKKISNVELLHLLSLLVVLLPSRVDFLAFLQKWVWLLFDFDQTGRTDKPTVLNRKKKWWLPRLNYFDCSLSA